MFTVFKKVLSPKADFTDDDITKVSDFVFTRWLSGNAGTLQIAQMFNLYSKIPTDVKLKVAQKIINGKIRYIPYPKSEKTEISENLKMISEFFTISMEKAKLYYEFISEQDMKYIKDCVESKYKELIR